MRFVLLSILACINSVYGQSWKNYADTAKSFSDQKNNAKSIEYYLKANDLLKKDSAATLSYMRNNNDIADLYVATGQYAKAEPFYVEGKLLSDTLLGKESADYATSCNNLGRVYRLLGQYEKSELLLLDAKRIREKIFGKNNADYAASCNNLAILYFEVGQYETARPLYLEAKEIREKVLGKENIDYAASCNNVAILEATTGHPELAEPLYIEAKNIREKLLGKEHPLYAASCNNLAVLYRDMGQYDKAESLYVEAKQIRERTLGKQHPEYAASCVNLAILYLDMGQYEKAEPLYYEAKEIQKNVLGPTHPEYAKSCNNLAVFYRALGQYDKAEPLFVEARNLLGSALGKENSGYATSCNNLGALYMDMGNYEQAEALYSEAKAIWEKVLGKEHPEYAKSCHNLALIYLNNGQYEKAEALLVEANQVREKALGKEHPDYAQGCDNLAIVYTDMGEFNKAATLHLQAKEIREKVLGKEHPDYIESCINLANLDWRVKKFGEAGDIYRDAFNSQQAQVKKIFQFTTEPEKQSYLEKVGEFKNYFLSYSVLGSPRPDAGYAYAVSLANRNLILSSLQQLRSALYSTADTSIKNKYNNWISSREQLSFWQTKPIASRPGYVKNLEEQANTLEKQLTILSAEFKKNQEERSWQKIQRSLKQNEAAVEFAEIHYYNSRQWTDSVYYIALLLRKDKPEPQPIRLFEKRELDSLLNHAENINALYSKNISLYNLTWKPLEKYLAGVSKIYFALSGNLFKISFAALPVNDKQVLSDKYELIQLNTTASVIDRNETFITASDKIQLYGGIQYNVDTSALKTVAAVYHSTNYQISRSLPQDLERGGSIQYLPGSKEEVEAVKKQADKINAPVTVLSGISATEESFKALSGKSSPSVLHIATHGFFFPDPKQTDSIQKKFETSAKVFRQSDNPLFRSGLLFSGAGNAWQGKSADDVEDGIVTAYDVSNMYLPNTKLVVLSACETALGDIQGSEGVYGLQRSFKIAGSQNLVMSLWKVPDAETSEFMQLFYKNLFNHQSVTDAFYHAQTEMKNKYRNEPNKWAAWILVR